MISLILPIYNEAYTLKTNLPKIIKFLEKLKQRWEILIVEESTDNTPYVADSFSKKYNNIKHIHSKKRLGKGGAVELGAAKSSGDKIVFMDIDLSADTSCIMKVVDELDNNDLVVCSRYNKKSIIDRIPKRLFLSRSYAIITRLLLGVNVSDFQCGLKGFNRKLFRVFTTIHNKGFFWDTELLFYSNVAKFSIKEVPVIWKENKQDVNTTIYMFKSLITLFLHRRVLNIFSPII